jgi:chromatin modification-related protein VID21
MCIDYREECKWKMALAYMLVNAVQEWHAAGSIEERVHRGICVIWPKLKKKIMQWLPMKMRR